MTLGNPHHQQVASRRARNRAVRPLVEALEGRTLLAADMPVPPLLAPPNAGGLVQAAPAGGGVHQTAGPNLAITAVRLVDSQGNPIASDVIGQMIVLRCDWTASGLAPTDQYLVRFTVDGVSIDTGVFTQASADGSYDWYLGGWFATPGTHDVQVTVDANDTVAEASESDNSISTSITPVAPTTLPYQLTQPIGSRANVDYGINNYSDVDPLAGSSVDYHGGDYQFDGNAGIDAGPIGFGHMDDGVPILAAAPGVVTGVHDGEYDRSTAFGPFPANYVTVNHGGGWVTIYFSLAADSIAVKIGDTVARGQMLGLMGSSGYSNALHLHFSLLKDGENVETGYAPSTYWAQPLPYAGDVPFTVLESGITNYPPQDDQSERVSDISTFPTTSGWSVFYWVNAMNVRDGDQLSFNWYRPDGSLAASSAPIVPRLRFAQIVYPLPSTVYSSSAGTWQAALLVNGVEKDRKSFKVTAGTGVPEILVAETATDAILINGRTTPYDFGQVNVGGVAPQGTLTIYNHGSQTLTTSGLTMPPGFSLVGTFPSSIAANDSVDFTFQMDTTRAGLKFGEVRFNTNDSDEGVFTFNVAGEVDGANPVGAATLTLPGPAVVYAAGQPPKVIDPTCDTSAGANYAKAVLQAEVATRGTGDDRLTILPGVTPDGPVGVSGGSVTFNGATVATFTGGLGYGSPLVVTFTAGTRTAVRAVARSIAYSNVSASPSTLRRAIRFTVTTAGVVSNQPVKTVEYDTSPRPAVESMDVADGASQRSQVKSVSVTFDRPVSVATGAATLVRLNTGGSGSNDGSAPTDASSALAGVVPTTPDDGFTWVFAFADGSPFVQNGSLVDGIYKLALDPARVSYYGVSLAYAASAGSSLTFHRLFGDVNGNGAVNLQDYGLFRAAFGKAAGQAGFDPVFDFDNNGSINTLDYGQFRNRFGRAFTF